MLGFQRVLTVCAVADRLEGGHLWRLEIEDPSSPFAGLFARGATTAEACEGLERAIRKVLAVRADQSRTAASVLRQIGVVHVTVLMPPDLTGAPVPPTAGPIRWAQGTKLWVALFLSGGLIRVLVELLR